MSTPIFKNYNKRQKQGNIEDKMDLKDFYYDLPQELIAQHPAEKRDMSRLMFLDKYSGEIRHGTFRDILGMFEPGDCLILNDSRVIPARLFAKRVSDGAETIQTRGNAL